MVMSMSEAGYLGFEKSKDFLSARRKEMHDKAFNKYIKENKKCLFCGSLISYEKRKNKFCDSSCSASYYNKFRKIRAFCINCGGEVKYHKSTYCSTSCQADYKDKHAIVKALYSGNFGSMSAKSIKRLLIKYRGIRCEVCGISMWMGKQVPLVIDHISGNHEDNSVNNVRLVCGNCDMQLPTYKSKNKGNGRFYRRERYKEGKSY
jgi:hypothetical protein